MRPDDARRRLGSLPVARLATVAADGRPHLVPVTFALIGDDTVVSAVDHKPKRTTALRRLDNIAAHPAVALLGDHYEDDWSALWWVRVDGQAESVDLAGFPAAVAALAERYPEYREQPPTGTAIRIRVERWSGWTAGA